MAASGRSWRNPSLPSSQGCQGDGALEPSSSCWRAAKNSADPAPSRPCFARLEKRLAKPPRGRPLQDLSGRTLIARDGTEYSGAQRRGCPHCPARQRVNRKSERYPAMLAATVVAPGHSRGVPRAVYRARTAQTNQDSDAQARQPLVSPTSRTARPLHPVYRGADRFAGQPIAMMVKDDGDAFRFAARKARPRRGTVSARAPRLRAARKNIATAASPRRCASAGSRPCRGAPPGAST